MAISSTYCTQRDVEDIYPQIDEFDSKDPIYGWVADTGIYTAYNVGLVTQLFIDGKSQKSGKQSVGTTALTTTNETFSDIDTTLTVTDGTAITDDSYIVIGSEIMRVSSIASDNLTVQRGAFGTNATSHTSGTAIYQHFYPSANGDWMYDSDNDFVLLKSTTNPNDLLLEAGEDFSTLMTRIMKNASRYLDARIDASLPRDQFKDKEGNYDYMIIRTTALISAYFLVNSNAPESTTATNFMDEVNFNIDQFNKGMSRLSGSVTGDASKGIVREVVAPQNANGLHIVDTRGHYTGIYDLVKVVINTAGVIGTAKFDVYGKSSSGLKDTKIVDALIINGQYQSIGNGLQIRFSGKDSSSTATLGATPDEWEIEVWGSQESIDDNIGQIRSTKMTRHGRGIRVIR